MSEEIEFDHFKDINELLEHIDLWYREDDIEYTRWFGLEDLYNLKIYITNLQQRVEQLENILNVEKYDYNYLKTLFSKSSKEEILKAYTYKCEQLEKVTEARNEFEMKSMQLENIKKEAIKATKDVKQFVYDELVDRNVSGATETHCKIMDLLNILNKGSNKE